MSKSGFIDIHTHGAVGFDINSATIEEIYRISDFFKDHGVDRWIPTIMTDTEERMLSAARTVAQAMRHQSRGARILGIHLEGPFLSPVYAGAMPQALLRDGDISFVENLQKAAEGHILLMTVAPEIPGVLDVIRTYSDSIKISLGHSNATYMESMKAIEMGAVCITHTCNAMRLFHMHEPGLLGAALESDVWCEIIVDGIHLAPGAVRILLKAKGRERILVVTDSMSATGCGDGDYFLGGHNVTVRNNDALLAGTAIRAGSVLTMDKAFENMKKFTGLSDEEILPMFGANQAEMLGIHY